LTLQIKNSDLKFLLFKSVDFLNPKNPANRFTYFDFTN